MTSDLIRIKLDYKSKQMENGCRIWYGAISYARNDSKVPYGKITVNGKSEYVHRLSFQLKHGRKASKLSHICLNSLCVNPNHLVEESQKCNNQRKKCRNDHSCTEIHFPVCLTDNIIGKVYKVPILSNYRYNFTYHALYFFPDSLGFFPRPSSGIYGP